MIKQLKGFVVKMFFIKISLFLISFCCSFASTYTYEELDLIIRNQYYKTQLNLPNAEGFPYNQGTENKCGPCAVANALKIIDHSINLDVESIYTISMLTDLYAKNRDPNTGEWTISEEELSKELKLDKPVTIPAVVLSVNSTNTFNSNGKKINLKIQEKGSNIVDNYKSSLIEHLPLIASIYVNGTFETTGATGVFSLPNNQCITEYSKTMNKSYSHAVVVVGILEENNRFWLKILNSRGSNWGKGGTAFMPFEYFENLCFQLYSVKIT